MIGIKLQGRLGNQLFQYAFAYCSAKKLGVSFYFDKRFQPELLTQYFDLKMDSFNLLDKYLFRIRFKGFFSGFLKYGFYSKINKILKLKEIVISEEINPEIEKKKIINNGYYSGYYQSEKYFVEFKNEILSKFIIRSNFITTFKNLLSDLSIPKKFTVVHVRRTDYLEHNIALPTNYFHKAIKSVSKIENFYVFITDDYQFVRREFSYLKNIYISTESEIIDFQFLMNAEICILSNSTFSWWGAYLNKCKSKVIAPKYWTGYTEKRELPNGIFLDTWDILDI